MVFIKRNIYIFASAALLILSIIFLYLFNNQKIKTASSFIEKDGPTIIVDAGHGGFDGGAVASDGTVEKDINLLISHKLKSMLQLQGFNVIMTRYDDSATDNTEDQNISHRKTSDLRNRLKLMNTTDNAIFISIHLNKFNQTSASGLQVFYSPNTEYSKYLAQSIQELAKEKLQQDNNRVIKQGTKSTYLLYNAKIPAVIVECGFLSNKAELAMLKKDEYQSKLAFSIFCGTMDYYKKTKDNVYGYKN